MRARFSKAIGFLCAIGAAVYSAQQQTSQRPINLYAVPIMYSEKDFAPYDIFIFDESGRALYSERGVARLVENTFEIPIKKLEKKVSCVNCHKVSIGYVDLEKLLQTEEQLVHK